MQAPDCRSVAKALAMRMQFPSLLITDDDHDFRQTLRDVFGEFRAPTGVSAAVGGRTGELAAVAEFVGVAAEDLLFVDNSRLFMRLK